ncbi:ABC transporter permease [Pseudonocardia cypriaca]|uniref:Monosaccharide ABC transporter membrane protein (CUT2 family) n=1 Tax=Pseudonocardia cypriaca TaxID=882449 RepID=A0A543GCD6_9PSEU|nr:ABC transporter permease [Pseudonocardia cypriaca]TQM43749.1 monosaccharide ABC transporter membrane protein (CUT2 family) [Pseudonocardia cypriaca]
MVLPKTETVRGATGAAAPPEPQPGVRELAVRYGFIAITVVLFVFFAATEESFRQPSTLFSMLKFASVVAVVGLGVTLTMVVGGLDLSVGAVAGMSVTISAMTMVIYAQVGGIAIALVLLAGALIGAVNALLIVVLRIPDLLATLASMFVVMGLKLVPVDGQSVSSGMVLRDGSVAPGRFTPDFLAIDRAFVGPVPLPVLIVGVLAVATWFFLTRTRWGRLMYAVGANPEASRLAGVRVGRYRALAYVLSGVFAAIGGLILSSRIGQGDISAGNSLLLDAVAVALVGTSVLGLGRPNAWGTILGAVLVGILITGLTITGFPYYGQDIVKGIVLLLALLFSFTLSRRRSRYAPAAVI